MLFVHKFFAVKRSKNELSKRNAMSARMFFHKFPQMYDFLLNELKSVAKIISSGAMCPEESALYPILILVAKLQPSIYTSNEDLNEKKYKVSIYFQSLEVITGLNFLEAFRPIINDSIKIFSIFDSDNMMLCT